MKLSLVFHSAVMMFVMLPTAAMDKPAQQQHAMINFHWNDATTARVKKSHLPLIKTLDSLYKSSQNNRSVELFSYVRQYHCAHNLSVVEDALNVLEKAGIDFEDNKKSYMSGSLETEFKFDYISEQFKKHYGCLSLEDRNVLIKLSGQYSGQTIQMGDNSVSIPMLNIPELTKHLIEVYIGVHDVRHVLKSYFNNDKAVICSYFKEQLIRDKGPLKIPKRDMLLAQAGKLDLASFFINGYPSSFQRLCCTALPIGNQLFKTYWNFFIDDDYELRITEAIKEQADDAVKKQYSLWCVDRKNGRCVCLAYIEHFGDIKGICFTERESDVRCLVTYADHDMVFSSMVITPDEVSFLDSIPVDSLQFGSIVGVCFNYQRDNLLVRVVTIEGDLSDGRWVSRYFNIQGVVEVFDKCSMSILACGSFPRQLFLAQDHDGDDVHVLVSFAADKYSLGTFTNLSNAGAEDSSVSNLCSAGTYRHTPIALRYVVDYPLYSFFVLPYSDSVASPFKALLEAKKKNREVNFFERKMNEFSFKPDSESFKRYSSDGTMLLCSALKKDFFGLYVQTTLKDASTRVPIITIDTPYNEFVGVGFSANGEELIFLQRDYAFDRVLLPNHEDKKVLQEAEDLMFENIAITALLKQLCMDCKKNGCVALVRDSLMHKNFISWEKKSPSLLKLLRTCLPMYTK